jgi:serine/threonine-protein kinase
MKQALTRVTLVFVMSFGLMASAPASAQYWWTTHFQNWATGRCLDSNSNGDVYTLPCQWGNPWQTWEIRSWGQWGPNGLYHELKDNASQRCLGSYGFNQWEERTGDCSNWGANFNGMKDVRGNNWGGVQFVTYNFYADPYPYYSPGYWHSYCTDATGGFYAQEWECNWGGYQTWRSLW